MSSCNSHTKKQDGLYLKESPATVPMDTTVAKGHIADESKYRHSTAIGKALLSISTFIAFILIGVMNVQAASYYYVRAGATGNNSGSDWTNAYSSLPSTLVRGAIYYIADGSYGGYTFDDPNSGSAMIMLQKATATQHGTNTGWNGSYGDGQASFGAFIFVTDYYAINGMYRNEDDWQDVSSYGFRISGGVETNSLTFGHASDNISFNYCDVGGAAIGNSYSGSNPDGFYIGGFGQVAENWSISHCHIHNVGIAFQCAGADRFKIEYNFIGPAWSKEAVRGQIRGSNFIIRHNTFWNSCQQDPAEGSGSACTAEIAMWGNNGSGLWDGNEIYGNIFQKTTNEINTGGVIVIGGNGTTWVGSPANNTRVYNNTIVGMQDWTASILINGGSGNVVRNNIWAGLGAGVASSASANSSTDNSVVSTSVFKNYPTDLSLNEPVGDGYNLQDPYNVDRNGVNRGSDGNWDIGAFESGSGGSSGGGGQQTQLVAAPTNLKIVGHTND